MWTLSERHGPISLRRVNGIARAAPINEGVFATTRWSVLRASASLNETQARQALEEICQTYWKPVYACIRHQGYSAHDAEDLTQDFLLRFLAKRRLEYLDEAKGRFRAYLSISLRHFLASHWRWRWRLRRGQSAIHVSLDMAEAEELYDCVASTHLTPASLYEVQWARTLIEQALEQLKVELRADGKQVLFGYFEALLVGETSGFAYGEVAQALSTSVGALHTALHRWRRRLGVLLREEIARTVASKAEVEEELRHLLQMFAAYRPSELMLAVHPSNEDFA